MKNIVSILLFIFITNQTFAQFENRTVLENSFIGITAITSGDINNDGFADIIISQKYNYDKISYYLNQGDGTFASQQTIMSNINDPQTVAVADFNNDGWLDIVSASFTLANVVDPLYIFMNNSTNNFNAIIIDNHTNTFNKIFKIKTADVDNDNDIDIVAVSDAQLNIYYNDGNGNFSKTIVDPGITLEYYDLTLSDIDNDNFIDVIVGATKTIVYKNTNGVFNYDNIRTNSIINAGLVFLVEMNDFDNDGDNDLLISGNNLSDLRWYENNGNGMFSLSQIFQTNITQCRSAISRDFDHDGDIDIFTTFPQTGKVVWYENLNTNFGSENIIYTGTIPRTEQVYADDFTNNGKYDIVWSQELSIHINNTSLNISESNILNNFEIYPNPSFESFNIKTKFSGEISIYDVLGSLIYSNINIIKGINKIEINLQPNMYLIVFKNEFSVTKTKLLIK